MGRRAGSEERATREGGASEGGRGGERQTQREDGARAGPAGRLLPAADRGTGHAARPRRRGGGTAQRLWHDQGGGAGRPAPRGSVRSDGGRRYRRGGGPRAPPPAVPPLGGGRPGTA